MNLRTVHKLLLVLPACLVLADQSARAGDSPESRILSRMAVGSSYAERIEAVQNADKDDISDLLEVVRNTDMTRGLNTAQERSLINETLNQIQHLGDGGLGLEALLEGVAKDSSRDPGVSEYALQHLYEWYPASNHKEEIERIFWEMSDGSIHAAVSVLYLHRLNPKRAVGEDKRLNNAILKAMRLYAPRDADKITLMAVASERGLAEGLPMIREWAQGPSWLVSVSAADSIGWLGDEDDIRYLKENIAIENIREGTPALRRAERRIALRMKGNGQ